MLQKHRVSFPLIEAFLAGRFGVPRWVKGHSGDVMNDRVDALAVQACQTGAGQSGRSKRCTSSVYPAGSRKKKEVTR